MLTYALIALQLSTSFQLAAAPKGLGIDGDDVETTQSSRTGHASFDKAKLAKGLKDLSGAERKAYDVVKNKLGKVPEMEQLDALVAFHRVSYKDMNGKPLIVDLATIVQRPAKFGISNVQLARDTISDVTRPSTIFQAGHGTCTATSISSALARQAPGEYVRIVADLGGTGKAKVRNGPDQLVIKDFIAFKDRATTGNLLQPAIMELEVAVNKGHYVNKEDKTHYPDGKVSGGAPDKGVSKAEGEILGGKYDTMFTGRFAYVKSKAKKDKQTYDTWLPKCMAILKKASVKNPVLIDAALEDQPGHEHEMQCVGVDGSTVTIRNPWGRVHKIPVAKVKAALEGVNYKVN